MSAAGVLLAIEAVIVTVAFLTAGRTWSTAALYAIFWTAPLEVYRTTIGGVNISLFRLSLILAAVVAVVRLAREGSDVRDRVAEIRRTPLAVAYVVLGGYIAATLVVNPLNTFLGVRLLVAVVSAIAAVVLAVVLSNGLSVRRLVAGFALGSVLPILAGAWQAIALHQGWDSALPLLDRLPIADGLEKSRDAAGYLGSIAVRERGPFADANHFGTYLIFSLLSSLALAVHAALTLNPRRAVGWGAITVAAAATLVATYSRSGWLGATVAVLVFAGLMAPLLRRELSRRAALIGAGCILLGGLAILVPLAPQVTERLNSSAAANEISDQSHRETASSAVRLFADHPVLGTGVGGIGRELDQGPRTSGAHSSYLTVAAELGAIGLLVLVVAGALALRHCVRSLRRTRGGANGVLTAAILAAYVGFLVTSALYDLWFDDFHWAVLALVAAAATVLAPTPTPTIEDDRLETSGPERAGVQATAS